MNRNRGDDGESSSDSDYNDEAALETNDEDDDVISFNFELGRSDVPLFEFNDDLMNSDGDTDDEEVTAMSDNDPTAHLLIYDDISEDGIGLPINDVDMNRAQTRSAKTRKAKMKQKIRDNSRLIPEDDSEPSWVRLPCEDTEYSDWQINVLYPSNSQDSIELEPVSYLVHRFKIGPQSNYFKSIFRDKNQFSEATSRISTIEFPVGIPMHLSPSHFEHFLDCLYSNARGGESDKEELLSLLYLADYFGVEELRSQAIDRIRYKLAFEPSHEWIANAYQLADSLSIEEFLFTIEWVCRCNLDYFTGVWGNLATIDLQRNLMDRLCQAKKSDPRNVSKHFLIHYHKKLEWQKLVLHVLKSSPNVVDEALFSKITDKDNFNLWSWGIENALAFLKHEQRLKLDEPENMKLTQLQEFCIEWLCDTPNTDGDPEETVKTLNKLKPAIMQNLLFQLMKNKGVA